jgi:peroxiredoxin (alkyl hydroperoxide reductase subunit C)
MKRFPWLALTAGILLLYFLPVWASSDAFKESIYDPGYLRPIDSALKVKVGEPAPEFSLPSLSGEKVTLSQFRDKQNVVISFVPAAWTPVCSDQWPGYNIAKPLFEQYDAILLGITVDNLPSLYAWTKTMGELWFPILSDFWPHGEVAEKYGLLRSDGTTERALIFIDKRGTISHIHIEDINQRPKLEVIVQALKKMAAQ